VTEKISIPADTPLSRRKRAVIIGASSGIGAEIAKELGRRGYYLALLARRINELQAVADAVNQAAGEPRAACYLHDVRDFEAIPLLFNEILADFKRIDSVVYVAGVMPGVEFTEFNFDKDRYMVEVGLLGGMAWLGQAATLFQQMKAGQIVGISSVAADRGRVKNPGYHAAKAGFDTYLEGLRNRLARSGVHILTVRPGPVRTALTEIVGGLMIAPPDKVARDIARAMQGRRQVLYTPRRWWLGMLIIRNIPSLIFRRLNF